VSPQLSAYSTTLPTPGELSEPSVVEIRIRAMSTGDVAPGGAGDRLRRIEAVTDAALAHLDMEELLGELLERVRELLDADTAAVLLMDPSSRYLVASAARGIEEEVQQGVRIPLGKGFAGRIAAEKRAVFIEQVDHSNVLNPILREKGIRSLLGVPLLVSGSVLGVLHVGTLSPRRFTSEDSDLLQLVADRVALAVGVRSGDHGGLRGAVPQHSVRQAMGAGLERDGR
jgi:signal transduction protein with GAF and PtsI domain